MGQTSIGTIERLSEGGASVALNGRVRMLFGVPIRALTMDEVVDVACLAIERRERLLLGVVNAAKLVNMRRDETLRRAVLTAELIVADGMSVVWASRILGRRLPERVAGIDLMHALLERGNVRKFRAYFLGATEEVLQATIDHVRREHPGVVIAGSRNGYFKEDEEAGIVADIRAARADLLFAAMTSPKKEVFLARWSNEMSVPVCHGVGGAFDVIAGKVKRAPPVWQRWGMEWLYRVLQEPRRMWRRYLVTNAIFCWMVVKERIKRAPSISA